MVYINSFFFVHCILQSKPSTLLQQLVDQLLLPFAVHNPDTKVHENIIVAIKSYLHLFIQGLMQLCKYYFINTKYT